jgi:DNA polymerase-3 subunit delta
VRALIDALGSDLREIASACAQLAADTTGVIDQSVVARYYRGRAEASGFSVADRAVEGRLADALELLRWALAVGVAPVLISSGLGRVACSAGSAVRQRPGKCETRCRVGAAVEDRPGAAAVRGWEPDGIARASVQWQR